MWYVESVVSSEISADSFRATSPGRLVVARAWSPYFAKERLTPVMGMRSAMVAIPTRSIDSGSEDAGNWVLRCLENIQATAAPQISKL